MDPISGIVLAMIMMAVRAVIDLINYPFFLMKKFSHKYPLRTARIAIGIMASGLLSYLLDVPYQVEITFSGGLAAFLAGELI